MVMFANRVLSIKEIVLVVHVTLVKSNVMRKLDGMKMIMQLKVRNHQNTFETTLITIYIAYLGPSKRSVMKSFVKIATFSHELSMMWKKYKSVKSVKSVRIRSFYGPYFPAFGLNTEIYFVNLRIHSERGKMRTRKIANTDTFYAVIVKPSTIFAKKCHYRCLRES